MSPGVMVMSRAGMLPRDMCGSVILLHVGSVLKFKDRAASKGHSETRVLGCNMCFF